MVNPCYLEWYISKCLPIYRLGHYEFRVLDEISTDSYMSLDISQDYCMFDIRVGEPLFDCTPTVIRQVAGHEMGHLHTAPIVDSVDTFFTKLRVPTVIIDAIMVWPRHLEERAADEIGHIVSPLLPVWDGPTGPEMLRPMKNRRK